MDRVDYQTLIIQDLVNLQKSDELNLNPWYQRRSVWTHPQKAYLINSIFEQKPIPSLYIRHSLDLEKEKSIREVVDGQQRIRSILEYVDGGFAARHPSQKRPIKFDQLTRTQREAFKMTGLSAGYLIGASDEDVIEIFGRLNSVAKTLNLQEKRNARFSGEFKQFCLKQSARRLEFWRGYKIFSSSDISRMQEVQLTSELVINMMAGLVDYQTTMIDSYYKQHDEDFEECEEMAERLEEVFSILVSLRVEAIRDTIFSRSPIFFTLFIVLDSLESRPSAKSIEEALYRIDGKYNSDLPLADRKKADADFFVACTSNMHRIKSPRIRDTYVRKHFK